MFATDFLRRHLADESTTDERAQQRRAQNALAEGRRAGRRRLEYEVPGQIKRDIRVVCGHWSTLGRFTGLGVHAIDTGCVWGGALTALRIDSEEPEFVSIKSDRKPVAGKEQD